MKGGGEAANPPYSCRVASFRSFPWIFDSLETRWLFLKLTPSRDCATALWTGFHLGRTFAEGISQAQQKNKHSGELHIGSGGEAIPGHSPVEVLGGFSPKPCPAATAPVAQPPRTRFALFPGWGMGGNWALPSPAPSEKTFSPKYSVLFKEGAFPFLSPRPGSRLPSLWINPPHRASLVQCVSLPPGEHGHTKKALLYCPPTAPTHRASDPAPHSPLTPLPATNIPVVTPTSIRRQSVIPSPCFSTCSQRVEACFNYVYWREISLIQTHKSQAKITLEKQGEMLGYGAPSQTSDRNLPR